ncbi:hypothetical protein, partial [Mesorhizobium sp. M7A.F.Ca.CA.004.05.2.1]
MLNPDDWKLAIEDARFRHNALVGLIIASDNQALALMRLFLTVATATGAGFASVIVPHTLIQTPLAWSLAAATLAMVYSAWQCFRVISPRIINLPGRGADFWLWAADATGTREEVFRQYLKVLAEKHEINKSVNESQASALRWAKLGGILSPMVALVVG